MDHEIVTLAERPELMDVLWDMETTWPEYMVHDPIGNSYYSCIEELFLDYVLVALDESGRIVAKAFSAPFQRPEGELPDAGWDFALRSAVLTRIWGETPNAVTAAEIAVEPALQGTGFSSVMVAALRANAGRLGFSELLAPVRPNGTPSAPATTAFRSTRGCACTTGPVVVPGALAPVMCDAEHGTATYVEPNVWVRHATGA